MEELKNNPYDLLKREGIAKKILSEKSLASLNLYDKAIAIYKKRPGSQEMKDNAEKAGTMTLQVLTKDIAGIKNQLEKEEELEEKKVIKKAQSKKIIEKSEVVLDDLAMCRKRLKEDRQRKLASGEIKAPVKKTLLTKLRLELLKLINLIPPKLKQDEEVLKKTERAILKFLDELKSIWGLNKIKPIQDEIKEKFDKLEEKAELKEVA